MGRDQGKHVRQKKAARKRKHEAKIDESEDDEEKTTTGGDGKKIKTTFDATDFISQIKKDGVLLADGGKKKQYIENKKRRNDTFSQRKKSLIKSMKELHAQTACTITFSITSPSGNCTKFTTGGHRTIGTQYSTNLPRKKRKSTSPRKIPK